jgi:hypothetical protein
MGSYLSKPVTTAHSQDLENHRLECGASSMQGWRESQEVNPKASDENFG